MTTILDLAAILENKSLPLTQVAYEKAHPKAHWCKISCLYDKMHTPSWILHDPAGLPMITQPYAYAYANPIL